MDAVNAPIRRARPETHTDDVAILQKPLIENREDLVDEVVLASPEVLQKDYADALAFAEEPVHIRIERSSEKFAQQSVDVWVNGKGAEVLMNGRWIETKVLPVGVPVTTKRKYVEVLARSKEDSVSTRVVKAEDSERNLVERYTRSKVPFSVLRDNNPKGVEWLNNLVRFA